MLDHLDPDTEAAAAAIVDAAFNVHSSLGPGLLESVYEQCLAIELRKRGLAFRTQMVVPLTYDGVTLDTGLRLDIVVEDRVIVELKSVDRLTSLHEAQILTYLRLAKLRLGLLINFNVPLIKSGIRRIVL